MDIVIAGVGQIPVGEHWELSLRTLADRAIRAAQKDAASYCAQGGEESLKPQALYIGNFLGHTISHQANLGALLTTNSGLDGIESFTIEAAEASGAAAFHAAVLAIASGFVDTALVLGIEKYTDLIGAEAESAVSQMIDYDYEAVQGMTPTAQAGLLMQRYLYEYHVPREVFADFALLAHANAVNNPNAMFRRAIRREAYTQAPLVSAPLNMFDVAPYADGAAAVLLTRQDMLPQGFNAPFVRVAGSSVVTDRLSLHDRTDPMAFEAAAISAQRASQQSGCYPGEMDLFEVWDGFSIYALLSLEATLFAPRGEGWRLLQEGGLGLKSKLPILTMGGQKARGNPLSASGVYQLIEATLQLRGQAGANQVKDARRAMVQTLGGPASTAVTHILERI